MTTVPFLIYLGKICVLQISCTIYVLLGVLVWIAAKETLKAACR